MDDTLRLLLAIAAVGVAGMGGYRYMLRKRTANADEAARRRVERKRYLDARKDRPAEQPVVRPVGFGRR